jgi:hypothetical protein
MGGREVTIYGAGMSGLVAAINLAREGYDVTVHERENSYGGSKLYNPSTHVTPLDPAATSQYIGVDISSAFHPVLECPSYFHDLKVDFPVGEVFAVERGDRPTSLDTLLYKECEGLPIKFEFGSPLKKEDIGNFPPDTIIACGLTPSVYTMMDIPYLKWYGWISRGEIALTSYAWLWWDECITEYGYLSAVNNYYFNLLFSIREVSRECLEKYKHFMVRNEGIEHPEESWEYVNGAVPLASPDNPRLYHKGAVMCGTMTGAMDPFMWFGISGALVTGKVAALAISDPARAEKDFAGFLKRYKAMYAFKNKLWYPMIRPKVSIMEKMIRTMGVENVNKAGRMTETGKFPVKMAVPGFSHMSCH